MTSWIPKESAPATFTLAEALAAAVSGDPTLGWLTGWIPLLGDTQVETAGFCARGPAIGLEPLDPSDFLTDERNPLASIANKAILILKLRDAAYDFAFAAYCRLPAPPPTEFGPDQCERLEPAEYQFAPPTVYHFDFPPDAEHLRARCTAADTPDGSRVFYCQLWLGGNGQTEVHWNDFINPSVPSAYLTVPTAPYGWVEARNFDWAKGGTVCFSTDHQGESFYTPVPQPEPPGVAPPSTRVYSTIADLGAELDRQELKLDHVINMVLWLSAQTSSPTMLEELPEDVVPGVVMPSDGAQGIVIRVTTVPPGVGQDFPEPGRYFHLGRVTLGTSSGWLPAIDISQTPLVIAPIPPWVVNISVNLRPDAHATLARLRATK